MTGSFSRTAVNADAGARSPLAAWFASAVIMFALLLLTSVFKYAPKFVLGSIVIVSVANLVEVHEVIFLWRVCRRDLLVFSVVFCFTLFTGVQSGLLVGILLNWASTLMHRVKAEAIVVVRAPSTKAPPPNQPGDATGKLIRQYSVSDAPFDASTPHGIASKAHERLVCLKLNGNVDFANSDAIQQAIHSACESFGPDIVVLDFSRVHTIDGSGVRLLQEVSSTLRADGVYMRLARVHADALEILQRAQLHVPALKQGINRWDTLPRSRRLLKASSAERRSQLLY